MLKVLKKEVEWSVDKTETNCTIITPSITQRNLMREILSTKKQASSSFAKINAVGSVQSIGDAEAIGIRAN